MEVFEEEAVTRQKTEEKDEEVEEKALARQKN